ncbi:PAS domain S-box protein [Namhaeicola litoreus]|uniref:PAS domain S-box protein n=1 Tax=Namhaeicola litoreus TaxID=1052145 RepID=A0ABW3Y4A1_9FLAO
MNNQLVEFLPGIFYVYEFNGEIFELIHWNKNHETTTGYSAKELKHKNVFDFFYAEDYSTIEDGLGEIIQTGAVKQVFANLKLKDGNTLPFLFEGHAFYSGETLFFMGVGIDMTEYFNAKKKLAQTKIKINSIKINLQKKERELLAFALDKTRETKIESELKNRIKKLALKKPTEISKALIEFEKELNSQPKENQSWEVFKNRFIEVHNNFFKQLQKAHPNLTNAELRICAYLKMKMSTDHISSILNITKDGVKKSRYRLRKKLNLLRNESLNDYVNRF